MARDAFKQETNSAVKSTYKSNLSDPRLKQKTQCEGCDTQIAKFAVNRSGNIGERKLCAPCWKKSRKEEKKQKKSTSEPKDEAATIFLSSIRNGKQTNNSKKHRKVVLGSQQVEVASNGSPKKPGRESIVLDHHIFDDYLGWTQTRAQAQPSLNVNVRVEPDDYRSLGLPCPTVKTASSSLVSDSGAQSCLWGWTDFLRCGFRKKDLLPVKQKLWAANRQPINRGSYPGATRRQERKG